MADMTARGLEDSAIIQQQQERITFLEEQFEQNKKAEAEKEKERLKSMDKWLATKVEEMMAEFMNSRTEATPQDIPIPETPQPQIRFSVPPTGPNIGQHRFTTSTPYTAAHGRDNPETPHPQNMHGGSSTYNFERGRTRPGYTPQETPNETPAASPVETRFGNNRDVKLPKEGEFTGLIDAKKANITFDGTDVEGFIKRLENIASILKCGSISLARQLPYITNNNKIGRSIELMEGHETGDWELLKKSLLRKWGRATPLRRYREESITGLVQKAVDKKGIKTNVEYRKFISEFEEMMDYFIRMEYNNLNPENGDPLWKALSDELKKEVTKELAHAKKLKKTKDVGMVDMTINDRKIRTLVDTGAEMNIIPEELANQLGFVTTEIFMRLRGIGGHFTPIVGLAENVDVSIFPGHKNLANFFIVKGSVHTVLGRPFLADHNTEDWSQFSEGSSAAMIERSQLIA
ncbi:hypothetical protein PCASD_03601 [Puccinia coronata f. sp. avenae]|uniref:Peptidase A2 domain-containing protein n=1 Tax=Puccinia coronata f. sp. avenae TaxID=200324 RepID=A0A2N5VDI8_9BASI|nr:hypothetical protein PCASD_03601 [Puccinia coronata f. sp. avenae]